MDIEYVGLNILDNILAKLQTLKNWLDNLVL